MRRLFPSYRSDLPPFEIREVGSISPSQFTAIERCPYQAVLMAGGIRNLLCPNPASIIGTVIHKLIDEKSRGGLEQASLFDSQWDHLVREQEDILKDLGYVSMIPLKYSLRDFALRKTAAKRMIVKVSTNAYRSRLTGASEMWLSDPDLGIRGRIDLVVGTEDGVRLIDYKTGSVLDDRGRVKSEYRDQMLLYGYLYYRTQGTYPKELYVVDITGSRIPIAFTPVECLEVAQRALRIIRDVNEHVSTTTALTLARPEKMVCRRCSYRPSCQAHWAEGQGESITGCDVKGTLVSTETFQNGTKRWRLEHAGGSYTIERVTDDSPDSISPSTNRRISAFDLAGYSDSSRYTITGRTTVYED
jgi:RecB family exonuclease